MLKKVILLLALLAPAFGQSVQQSGTVTPGHVPYWVTSGVIADGGSSASSPITSIGVTNNGGAGICVNSALPTVFTGYNSLCFGAATNGPATISLQNYGSATAQNLNFVLNGVAVTLPTGGGSFVTATGTPFTVNDVACFATTGSVIKDCGLTIVAGTVTAGTWNGTAIAVANGGTGATTAAGARTNLGLGTLSTQNANAIAVTGGTITGLPTPTNPTDAAIKSYVDSVATGLNILASSTLATAAVLPNTPTYANGSSGVGATLTSSTNSTLTVDGTVAVLNTVVLVKNQAVPAQNGIYTVTTAGSGSAAWVLTRATYFDTSAQMVMGSYTFVTSGSSNIGSSWTLQGTVTTVGTTAANFAQFSLSGGTVNSVTCGATVITTSGVCPTIAVVKKQIFTTSGTYTPSTGLQYAVIECVGGGGSSGATTNTSTTTSAASSGGGGGAYAKATVSAATIGASQIVTVGAGGAANFIPGSSGSAGGTTSVGALCSAGGGGGGGGSSFASATYVSGAVGGTATIGDLLISGESSAPAWSIGSPNPNGSGSAGGSAGMGFGAGGFASINAQGGSGLNYGGGAGGNIVGPSSAAAGSYAGAPGVVYITEYTNQ